MLIESVQTAFVFGFAYQIFASNWGSALATFYWLNLAVGILGIPDGLRELYSLHIQGTV